MARPGFTSHPKFRRLVHLLGMPEPHVLGHLEFLWAAAYENGEPVIGDAIDVELAAKWTGERGKLVAALSTCGGPGRCGLIEAVEGQPDAWQIHDLFDHAPDYVQARRAKELARKSSRICEQCGGPFKSPEAHARYCCNACRQAHYRSKGAAAPRDGDEPVTESDGRVTQGDEAARNGDAPVTQSDAPPAPAPAPAPAPGNTNTSAGVTWTARAAVDGLPWFEAWWLAYPDEGRRVDKRGCRAKWTAKGLEARGREIVEHLDACKRSGQWQDGKQPMTTTYLNQSRYESAPPPPPAPARMRSRPHEDNAPDEYLPTPAQLAASRAAAVAALAAKGSTDVA